MPTKTESLTSPPVKARTSVADPSLTQLDKFKAAAREIGTDDDPERFKERVRRVASAKQPKRPDEKD